MAMLAGKRVAADDPAEPTERVHPAAARLPTLPPKAKAVIYLHMNGRSSQLDLLDHKPKLIDRFGEELPDSIRKGNASPR
ncbi:MAG: hypothetical protein U0792_08370 [Gemmataceae bacterium]